MNEQGHYAVGPFCGGCPFSTALHKGCTADPEGSQFRVLEPNKIAQFSSAIQGIANADPQSFIPKTRPNP